MSSNSSQLVMTVMSFSLICSAEPTAQADPGKNAIRVNDIRFRVTVFTIVCTSFTVKPGTRREPMANRPRAAAGDDLHPLWFSPPDSPESRRALTRERVVAEALTVISTDGAAALSMRALAARLGVVPGAIYRHVRSKEQLLDLVVDGVLAEVDCQPGPTLAWTEQIKVLAHRLRA